MKFLALSGSLRAASTNSALLRATARLAQADVSVELFTGLGDFPLFNPDNGDPPPASVAALYARIAACDALIIASPEYAHGVTGTIKNTLDWLVGYEPFAGMLVAVLNASPRAHHADDALRETLKTMAAEIVEPASIVIPLLGAHLDEDGMVDTPTVAVAIRGSLAALREAVARRRSGSTSGP